MSPGAKRMIRSVDSLDCEGSSRFALSRTDCNEARVTSSDAGIMSAAAEPRPVPIAMALQTRSEVVNRRSTVNHD